MKRRRRKKTSRPANPTEQLAPLQPAYPEDRESAEPAEASGAEPEPQEPQAGASQRPAEGQRKKRRRGGRGRNKLRKGASAAPAESPALSEPPEGPEPAVEGAVEPAPTAVPSHLAGRHRASKGTVVLTIGLPGSGKTSWFRRRGITPLSSDLLRMMLFDDISEQRYQDLVFSTLRYLLRARMIAHMPWNYVDATNLSPRERRGWIKMAQEFGFEVHAVFFDVPMDVCVDRNQRRGRLVPEDVMQRMAQKLRPPTFEEGFTKITVVRVKKPSRTEPEREPDNEIQQVDGTEREEQF